MEHKSDKEHALRGYLACALWSSTHEEHHDFEQGDFADGEEQRMSGFLFDWIDSHYEALDRAADLLDGSTSCGTSGWELVGHNAWLSQQGHGTGFWDREPLGVEHAPGVSLGDYLTEKSKELEEHCDLYFGDDGLIYYSRVSA